MVARSISILKICAILDQKSGVFNKNVAKNFKYIQLTLSKMLKLKIDFRLFKKIGESLLRRKLKIKIAFYA